MTTLHTTSDAPFHRLLSFYSGRSQEPDNQTIRLRDSITGNLALGLDFPVALAVAIGRHLYLRNAGFFSLAVYVPTVSRTLTPLHGVLVDEKADYSCSELMNIASQSSSPSSAVAGSGGFVTSVLLQVEAMGLWSLAADVRTGRLSGADVVAFQHGTLFGRLEKRRKGRDQVLPLWRGGPFSVVGHSWVVERLFGVQVYLDDEQLGASKRR